MKIVKYVMCIALALSLSVFLVYQGRTVSSAEEGENHCFSCHTNPRKLIQITREIAKAQEGKATKSSETSGEG